MVAGKPGIDRAPRLRVRTGQGLEKMSVRCRLLAEAEKQNSNPFLLCALVSLRTRQLMMTGNEYASTAQLVDLAIKTVS